MRITDRLLTGRFSKLLLTATLLLPSAMSATPPLNIGNPVTMPDYPRTNGDDQYVLIQSTGDGYEFQLCDKELNVIKQFSINVMVSTGSPVAIKIQKGPDDFESYYLTQHLFNSDDLYEVWFSSGEIYNELGQFIGTVDSNVVYSPGDDHLYFGGNSEIDDITDETQMWIDRHNEAIPTWMKELLQMYSSIHSDFGAPSIGIMTDAAGTDVVGDTSTYNWFTTQQDYELHDTRAAYANILPYDFYYLTIDRCNKLINWLKNNDSSSTTATILADAYAVRAWSYMNLAQRFQFTYFGNESKPCVPLVTEDNTSLLSTSGVYRSTVSETYDLIMDDLDKAINLLEGDATEQETILPGASKMMVTTATAYGLRARANLIMHRYEEAEADAAKAISLFDGQPYAIGEIQPCGFNNLDDSSWMWGLRYDDPDNRTSIVSFQSFMSPFRTGGYNTVTTRNINASLFESIPQTDVRRNLFIDSEGNCQALTEEQLSHLQSYGLKTPYRGVKFGAARANQSPTRDEYADYPLMRVEEMYYIVAEAKAMSGNVAEASNYLQSFVNEYRDPAYQVPAGATADQLRDQIWMQRRMEFWGEGLSFLDLMRLGKGVNRLGGGYPAEHVFNIAPDDNILLLRFPSSTKYANYALSSEDFNNNPEAGVPTIYTEDGEIRPETDLAYYYHTWEHFYCWEISYTVEPSDLHQGWKKISPFMSGIGNVTIHFDPESGTAEIPVQNATAMGEGYYVTDSHTFFNTPEYAGASKVTKRDSRKYDMKLDLVVFRYGTDGSPLIDSQRVVWVGAQPTANVSMQTENGESIYWYLFTDEESTVITISGTVDDGYKLYLDIFPKDAENVGEELLGRSPLTGSFTITKNVTQGEQVLFYHLYDEEGNLRNCQSQYFIAMPSPFKDTIEEYGEWSEWKDGGTCQYDFTPNITTPTNTFEFDIRRNIANPSLVNIRLLLEAIDVANRDIIIDLNTGLATIPYHDTGIPAWGGENVCAADAYSYYKDTKYILWNKLSPSADSVQIYVIYEIDGEVSGRGVETLTLPDNIYNILSDQYQPSMAGKGMTPSNLSSSQIKLIHNPNTTEK